MSNSSNPFIAIEEFYLSNDFSPTSTNPADPALYLLSSNVVSKLKSLGPSRIRDMRANNVAMQVLSHIPVDASPKTCQKLNDTLYSSMIMNQDRFAALAMLPCWDAKEAASELQRCVTKYKFVGGVLGFRRGVWEEKAYDGQAFEELWKAAERYKVPIALRPLFPTRQQVGVGILSPKPWV
jgi:predicted TIM-barrel fold metal-dependent hydrolase